MTSALRSLANALARTPLHPQWLLGRRRAPAGLRQVRGRVLDIGAADRWIEKVLPPGTGYVALDYPATGRELYRARPDVFADGARLPFADASFDAVVCLEVIEHVPEPAAVIAEIARVLRPEGEAWLSMPFLYPVHDAPFDFRRFTVHGFRHEVAKAGLSMVEARRNGHPVAAAGLLMALALAGPALARRGPAALVLAAMAAPLVLLVNCLAWTLAAVWPDWDGMAIGHEVKVRKP